MSPHIVIKKLTKVLRVLEKPRIIVVSLSQLQKKDINEYFIKVLNKYSDLRFIHARLKYLIKI